MHSSSQGDNMAPSAVSPFAQESIRRTKTDESAPQSYLMDRDLNTEAAEVISAQGNYIELDNGQRMFDATGGAAVACLGHGNKEVIDAVSKQMQELSYCHSMFFKTRCTSGLAEELIAGTDYKLAKAFIICSGSYIRCGAKILLIHKRPQVRRLWKQP
jgi:adenosylmethionine-8-amino-7-oxononanoate aminotransferase